MLLSKEGITMELIIKIATIWVSSSVVIIATGWYARTIIKILWPNWWEREIVGYIPEFDI